MIADHETAHRVHYVFEAGSIALGVLLYRLGKRRAGEPGLLTPGSFAVTVGCLAGAALGNKAMFWFERADLQAKLFENPLLYFSGGQSIVGGLVGGLIGVELAKRLVGITRSTGDRFVVPILAATMLGRVGCFLAGLHDDTYGVPTSLPWGVDFGDGVRRHPTQLYDILVCGGLLAALTGFPSLARVSGLRFKLMLASYLAWRLAIDALKPARSAYVGGLTGIQLVCLVTLACYLPFVLADLRRLTRGPTDPAVPLL
jgi:prolipoprotein diacylglyceryltransferase